MNQHFKLTGLLLLLFIIPAIIQAKFTVAGFDKKAFYDAMASENADEVNTVLIQVKESNMPEKKAYEGALLMKKAGLVRKAKDKLNLFKEGRIKLEAAIKADPDNIEYHFLRLIIQEKAPNIVKYKSELKKDSGLVIQSFKTLPPPVQQAVRDYSKNSKFLKPSDF